MFRAIGFTLFDFLLTGLIWWLSMNVSIIIGVIWLVSISMLYWSETREMDEE